MNELQIFKHDEFGEIRTVEINGEPWMVGRDIAAALGYANASKAVMDHVDNEDKRFEMFPVSDSQNRNLVKTALINESGLYSLVLSSKLPGAKRFRRWVTSEVLPAIRQTGGYIQGADELPPDELMARALLVAQRTLERQKARLSELETENAVQQQAIADFQPIRQYVDQILASPGTLTTTQIAADYDLSAHKLNKILHEARLQRSVNGQWVLYAEHMGCGYTSSRTVQIMHSDGTPDTKMHTVWTQKGRLKIHELLTARGIAARMDKAAESSKQATQNSEDARRTPPQDVNA